MTPCRCDIPQQDGDRLFCRTCQQPISETWASTDSNIKAFFDELSEVPGIDPAFVRVCIDREKEGRSEYGMRYLGSNRSNPMEAVEEAADLAIYSYLHLLKCERDGTPEKREYAITAAYHAAMAYSALMSLRNR